MGNRNLHLRLQEYCDCFVESDIEAEMEKFLVEAKGTTDMDETEMALKMLGLSLLMAIERHADQMSFAERQISVTGNGRGLLATLPADLVGRSEEILRAICGIDGRKNKGTISLGLRGGELMLSVESPSADDTKGLRIAFSHV